jgi:hypothetical protein
MKDKRLSYGKWRKGLVSPNSTLKIIEELPGLLRLSPFSGNIFLFLLSSLSQNRHDHYGLDGDVSNPIAAMEVSRSKRYYRDRFERVLRQRPTLSRVFPKPL